MNTKAEIKLTLTADRAYIPLVTGFMEQAAQALGLARKEALALTLAAEELCTYLIRLIGPDQNLEIRCLSGGYYVRADFTFTAQELNLRAFNLTSSVSLEDEASLEEMGLLIASRSVDYFQLHRDHQRLVLSLIKEKTYPPYEKKENPPPPPAQDHRLKTPGPGEVKWLAELIGEYFSPLEVPGALLYPGKLVDMVESGEFQAALAVGPAGEVAGGILWHWIGEKTVEFLGPYVFPPGSNPERVQALIDFCLAALARTRAVGLINRWSTSDLPWLFFETLGSLTFSEPDGKKKEAVHYFRQVGEDPGSTVWVVPELETFLRGEYRRLVLPRSFHLSRYFGEARPDFSVLAADLDRRRKTVTLRPVVSGKDIENNIRQHLRLFQREQIKNIFCELDLGRSGQADFAVPLLSNGFSPRIIIPYGGTGDLLVFQGKAV
ncbi:MAG: hypothetical protein HY892_19800 [Deltaproteobacteria bacterium]|nr:hypothetical protein [Deltaproteobacteria bacterium]